MSRQTNEPETAPTRVPIRTGLFEEPSGGRGAVLLGNRCRSCGRSFFPRRSLCPTCFVGGELEPVRLNRRGTIYSSTVVHIPSPAGIQAPYAYGYVDLEGEGLRVFALFDGEDPEAFRPGLGVELVVDPIRTDSRGREIIGYRFRLADLEGSAG